jgi:putative transcriptional regulator
MQKLFMLRKENKLTQKEMARLIGLSISFYTKVENNTKNPSYNFIFKVKNKFPNFDTNIFFTPQNHI